MFSMLNSFAIAKYVAKTLCRNVMIQDLFTTSLIIVVLHSCKQAEKCDFKSYSKSIFGLKQSTTFRTAADFNIPKSL